MELLSAKDVANRWGISARRVATLCSEERIPNAQMVGNSWVIPSNVEKPKDARHTRYAPDDSVHVKPFLKWAGGKSQLLKEIQKYYPFGEGITKYAEPFVGGGAVLFNILNQYDLEEVYISDINAELINTYQVVRSNIDDLLQQLDILQKQFLPKEIQDRKKYYMDKRFKFNQLKTVSSKQCNIEKAALMIFLNRTCFNGLYRVNKKGEFNVPMGSYKNPLICDEATLNAVSQKLQQVEIVCGDYRESAKFIDNKTFVYFDPPYRPLSETSGFTAYTENAFGDQAQIQLAQFVTQMHEKGAHIVVSNSDPKNTNTDDNFFDDIYDMFTITRVQATRMINSNVKARGKIKELLVSNY